VWQFRWSEKDLRMQVVLHIPSLMNLAALHFHDPSSSSRRPGDNSFLFLLTYSYAYVISVESVAGHSCLLTRSSPAGTLGASLLQLTQ
jgi:hypothetical protein